VLALGRGPIVASRVSNEISALVRQGEKNATKENLCQVKRTRKQAVKEKRNKFQACGPKKSVDMPNRAWDILERVATLMWATRVVSKVSLFKLANASPSLIETGCRDDLHDKTMNKQLATKPVVLDPIGILLSPMIASAAVSLSSVSVIAKALRLRNLTL
jgi:hypothetical protein